MTAFVCPPLTASTNEVSLLISIAALNASPSDPSDPTDVGVSLCHFSQ